MIRTLAVMLTLLAAVAAFGHAGHAHTYMGTVTALHDDGSFAIHTTDGKDVTIQTSPKTVFTPAKPEVGHRVVVKMMADGKTAASVKTGH